MMFKETFIYINGKTSHKSFYYKNFLILQITDNLDGKYFNFERFQSHTAHLDFVVERVDAEEKVKMEQRESQNSDGPVG